MLPRLQAQEQLAAMDVGFMGNGGYDENTARETLEGLRAKARGDVEQVKRRKARPEDMAAMGIGVTILPPERPLSDV